MVDDVDRQIINRLQGHMLVAERPFAVEAATMGLEEDELLNRLRRLLDANVLTRFGPLFDIGRIGGHVTLAAMAVPADRFDTVAGIVNAFPEVAHNYARDHALSMWFVVEAETAERVAEVLRAIAAATGLTVHDLPKTREFRVGLRLEA